MSHRPHELHGLPVGESFEDRSIAQTQKSDQTTWTPVVRLRTSFFEIGNVSHAPPTLKQGNQVNLVSLTDEVEPLEATSELFQAFCSGPKAA